MNKFFLIFLFLFSSYSHGTSGDAKGNGTDYLETLFANAKVAASGLLEAITVENINRVNIPSRNKKWLLKPNDVFDTNLEALQAYINVLSLEFIEYGKGGCEDPELNITHGICYYDSNPHIALVKISKDRNKKLANKENFQESFTKAMAMLIHEAGHFAKEYNHYLLDDLGAQLASIYKQKASIILSEYSRSAWIPQVTGDVKVDLNSNSISIDNILISGFPIYYRNERTENDYRHLCKSLGFGKEIGGTQKHIIRTNFSDIFDVNEDGIEFKVIQNDFHSINKIICEIKNEN